MDQNSHITAIINKQFVQTNFNPETDKFETWTFKLIFKKQKGDYDDADSFSDVLLSFILYIFSDSFESEEEGLSKSIISTQYERSHVNRSICLAHYGYNCQACNINLKDKYGNVARDHIEVHHLKPISTSGRIKPDPIEDFIPLCPNCHSIVHKRVPPLTLGEIKKILEDNGKNRTK